MPTLHATARMTPEWLHVTTTSTTTTTAPAPTTTTSALPEATTTTSPPATTQPEATTVTAVTPAPEVVLLPPTSVEYVTYVEVPAPAPTLPHTGADVSALLAVAGINIALGVLCLVAAARRNRRNTTTTGFQP